MLYDTILLRTFAAVCDAGSFTKAARVVNLTQSAVSLHVKRLEEQVGAQLLRREPQGVRPTEQGEVLLSYARRILALNKEAERRLGGKDERPDPHRRAGIFRSADSFRFCCGNSPRKIRRCGLQIELGIGPDIAALLEAGDLDLAILSREIGEGDGIALSRERRIWAAGRAMRLDPDQPAPLALYPANCRWRQVVLDRARPRRAALDGSGSKLRHRRYPRGARRGARDHDLPGKQPAGGARPVGQRGGAAAATGFRIRAAAKRRCAAPRSIILRR